MIRRSCFFIVMKKKLIHILAQSGVADKKILEKWIQAGRVKVSDNIITAPGFYADRKKQKITIDGKPLTASPKNIYLLFHKPIGLTCQKDPGHSSVYDVIKKFSGLDFSVKNSLFVVGRLDRETTGLLVLTNDGISSQGLLHPSGKIEKEYEVTVKGAFTPDKVLRVKNGLRINIGDRNNPHWYKTRPCRIIHTKNRKNFSRFNMVITEGKKNQIRRMLAAVGCNVVKLKRIRMGTILLGGLKSGEYKHIASAEIKKLIP